MTRTLALASLLLVVAGCSGEHDTAATAEHAGTGPAQRVVTLAPHLAEMMHAVGAEQQLVGVSAWSDYPPSVRDLPAVGDAFTVDQEQLRLLEPDLLLIWESGMPANTVDELRQAGYRVEVIRTRGIADVGNAMTRIGELTGRQDGAAEAVARYEREIGDLRRTYADATPVTVFFQVSARPLYTVSSQHFISEIIALCGGQNVFADLNDLAPSVAVEAVIDRDPDVMLAGTNAGDDAFAVWSRWPELAANRLGNQFLVPDELIGRPTPRLPAAGRAVCLALDLVRDKRDVAPAGESS